MLKKFSQARWLKPVISALTWGKAGGSGVQGYPLHSQFEASKLGIHDTLSKTYPRKGGKDMRENNRETK